MHKAHSMPENVKAVIDYSNHFGAALAIGVLAGVNSYIARSKSAMGLTAKFYWMVCFGSILTAMPASCLGLVAGVLLTQWLELAIEPNAGVTLSTLIIGTCCYSFGRAGDQIFNWAFSIVAGILHKAGFKVYDTGIIEFENPADKRPVKVERRQQPAPSNDAQQ